MDQRVSSQPPKSMGLRREGPDADRDAPDCPLARPLVQRIAAVLARSFPGSLLRQSSWSRAAPLLRVDSSRGRSGDGETTEAEAEARR